jgi:hypothetical protein
MAGSRPAYPSSPRSGVRPLSANLAVNIRSILSPIYLYKPMLSVFRIITRTLIISLAWSLSSCVPHGRGTYFTSGIRDYTGDGTIQDTSERDGFLQSRSYLVTLQHFPLNKPYEQTFRLGGLPTMEGKMSEIALFVPTTFSESNPVNARCTLEFSLSTADGKGLTNLKSKLGALTWSSPPSAIHYIGHAIYHREQSFFQPIPGQRYILHVKYSPVLGADGGEGYIYLWTGIGGS